MIKTANRLCVKVTVWACTYYQGRGWRAVLWSNVAHWCSKYLLALVTSVKCWGHTACKFYDCYFPEKIRRLLCSCGPCYQNCWHTGLLHASLIGSVSVRVAMKRTAIATDNISYQFSSHFTVKAAIRPFIWAVFMPFSSVSPFSWFHCRNRATSVICSKCCPIFL